MLHAGVSILLLCDKQYVQRSHALLEGGEAAVGFLEQGLPQLAALAAPHMICQAVQRNAGHRGGARPQHLLLQRGIASLCADRRATQVTECCFQVFRNEEERNGVLQAAGANPFMTA